MELLNINDAINLIKDDMTIMAGGFLANGTPNRLIDSLVSKNTANLTLICNDTGFEDKGVGKLIVNNQIKRVIASHIGTNRTTGMQMNRGDLEVELVPQGTLIERIRCGGFGLGGVLTQAGLNTAVDKTKQKVTVDGVTYLLDTPLKADVSLIHASEVDRFGNLRFHGSTRNFNEIMAYAAEIVIVEAEKFVDYIDPSSIHVPSVLVDYVIEGSAD